MDVFDEDAEPFDLKDDADVEEEDDDYEDDLEEATEDDVDLVVALYREDGKATAVPLDFDLANDLDELIRLLRDEFGVSVLLIEHDMKLVMNISDRIYVMEYGKEIAQGTPQQIKENPKVIEAYLGEEAHA